MKILVTGGSGFIGFELCKQLLEEGHTVISLQRNFSDKIEQLGITQCIADLTNAGACYEKLKDQTDIDAVFHTAAKAGIWGSYKSYYAANVVATENILNWCKKSKIKYLIYTSTPSVVYGEKSLENVDESLPYPSKFLTYYAQTKAQAEALVLSAHSHQLQVVSLRPHLVFGPGDPHLIPRIIARSKQQRLWQIGNAQNLVDVIHVSNAAYAHLCALNFLVESPLHGGKPYFIAQERPVPLWWFIDKILSLKKLPPIRYSLNLKVAYLIGFILENCFKCLPWLGEPPMTRFLAKQLGTSHYFNQSAAIMDLAYRPKISIEDGLHTI